MKKYFGLIYWSVMTVILSLILTSLMGSFGYAFFLSVMLLSGILFVKVFSRDISFKERRLGILHTLYLVIIALLIEYLAIVFVYWFLYGFAFPQNPKLILNPLFIWFLVASLLSIEQVLKNRFFSSEPEEKYITFTSERKKVALERDAIAYIESNDERVSVVTLSGRSYPTRMNISQWESVLDGRFQRVHRAFIVNKKHVTRFDSHTVYIGDLPIDMSRKYKERVLDLLNK